MIVKSMAPTAAFRGDSAAKSAALDDGVVYEKGVVAMLLGRSRKP